MSLLRPFRTRVDPIARSDPWSTTQLLPGVTGPFDIRNPGGSQTVAILPATLDGVQQALPPPQLYLPGFSSSVVRLDHVSPLPTIAFILTGTETSRRNTTGTLRVWVSASADLQNGAWCEIERTVIDDDPNNLSGGSPRFFSATPNFSFDDGRSSDLPVLTLRPGFPMYNGPQQIAGGGGVRSIHRIVRVRYGYTQDGVDVVLGSYRALTTRSSGLLMEIALTPLDDVPSEFSPRAVSVVFADGNYPASVFSFECPGSAVNTVGDESLEPINALQWTHQSTVVVDELRDPLSSTQAQFTASTNPIPVELCYLGTVIDGNVTATVPRVAGFADTLNHQYLAPGNQFPISSNGTTSSQGFIGTPQQGRPDISSKIGFSVKNGPWWHDRALVSPGTAAAVIGARHRLNITMPAWNQGLASPSVFFIFNASGQPRQVFIDNNASLHRRAIQGQPIVCEPTIGGEPLLQQCYTGTSILPLIDTQTPGPYDPAITDVDFTLLPYAQWFVSTAAYTDQNIVQWPSSDPWATLDSATDAGISADDYNFYRRPRPGATVPANSFAAAPAGVELSVSFIMTYQWTITRIAPVAAGATPVTGNAVSHFVGVLSLLFFLTDEQCVDLANGQTVDVPQYNSPPRFGGTPTGDTAAMSLSVLS